MQTTLYGSRTAYVLEIDPALARVLDERTLDIPAPPFWVIGPDGARYDLTTEEILSWWLDGRDDWLEAVGVRVISIVEEGVGELRRPSPAAAPISP